MGRNKGLTNRSKDKLSFAQFEFAEAIAKGLNQSAAAQKAGVEEKNASAQANKWLNMPKVKEYIAQRKKEIYEIRRQEIELDELDVTEAFRTIYNRCMQAKPFMKYDKELGEFVQQRDDETGEPLFVFDSAGANKAMENIGKHIGYFEKDNLQKKPVIQVAIQINKNSGDKMNGREIGEADNSGEGAD